MSEHNSAQQWSSRSLGSRFQHQIFYVLVRWRLMPLAHGLLRAVVFYYTLLPWVRRRCVYYVQRRFGVTPENHGWQFFVHAYRLCLSFGCILLDRMTATATGSFAVTPEMTEARHLLCQVLTRRRGCIVLSAHAGAWQLGLAALEVAGVPVNMLQWRDPEDVDKHYFEAGRGQPVQIIDASQPVEAMVQAATALRRGEVLAIMGDRLTIAGEAHVEVDFLGQRVALPITAYALASITGAPLVMVSPCATGARHSPFWRKKFSCRAGWGIEIRRSFSPMPRNLHGPWRR